MEREIDTDANNDVIGGPACGEKGKRVLSIQGRGRGNVNSNDTSTSHMTAKYGDLQQTKKWRWLRFSFQRRTGHEGLVEFQKDHHFM